MRSRKAGSQWSNIRSLVVIRSPTVFRSSRRRRRRRRLSTLYRRSCPAGRTAGRLGGWTAVCLSAVTIAATNVVRFRSNFVDLFFRHFASSSSIISNFGRMVSELWVRFPDPPPQLSFVMPHNSVNMHVTSKIVLGKVG
jgi:hypothetical protein